MVNLLMVEKMIWEMMNQLMIQLMEEMIFQVIVDMKIFMLHGKDNAQLLDFQEMTIMTPLSLKWNAVNNLKPKDSVLTMV